MTLLRAPFALLLATLLAIPLAVAQAPGPTPGSDPLSHAQDHAAAEARNATADPVGHGGSLASPEGVGRQVRTAAYVACWAAHEMAEGVAAAACAPFFTPPERALRPAPESGNATHDAAAANATLEAAGALVNAAAEALNQTLSDPGRAPAHLRGFLEAAAGFANATLAAAARAVGRLLEAATGLGVGTVEGILTGLGLGATGIGAAADALAKAGTALLGGVARGASEATDALTALAAGAADALAATGAAVAAAAGVALEASLEGAASLAQAAGGALQAVLDGVAGLLGGGGRDQGAPSGTRAGGLGLDTPADGLLRAVRGTLPL